MLVDVETYTDSKRKAEAFKSVFTQEDLTITPTYHFKFRTSYPIYGWYQKAYITSHMRILSHTHMGCPVNI